MKEIFEETLEERDRNIKSLEDRIERLESSLAVVNRLEYKIDNEEQYSRRRCLRINNVQLSGESEDCMQKVEDILTELDCGVGIISVDRANRIGQRKKNGVDGKVHQQIIMRFSSFRDRTKVYRNNLAANCNLAAKMKNGKFLFFFSVGQLQQIVDEENSYN